MATSVFNLSAVDRTETDVINIGKDVASMATAAQVSAVAVDVGTIKQAVAAQQSALTALAKTLNDFVNALGGSDQPAIDTATAAIRKVTEDLAGTVTRDQPT